jgi:hypothetical protein
VGFSRIIRTPNAYLLFMKVWLFVLSLEGIKWV